MKIINIIPLQKGAFTQDLSYFTAKDILVGSVVSVPVRSKKILGLVVSTEEVSTSKSDIKNLPFDLKKVIEIKDHSIWRNEFLEAAFLCAKYFATKSNNVLTSIIPSSFRENYDKLSELSRNVSELNNPQNKIMNSSSEIRSEKLILQLPLVERISIYKTLIRESFASKKSIFFILPNEQSVTDFYELLSKGIENFTIAIHSELSSKKILKEFEKSIDTSHSVLIICTAQFLAIPRYDIGTIILENESSNGYKMISRPYIDFRTFVEIFAEILKSKLIFADTLLRFETIARRELDNFAEMHPLSFRLNFKGEISASDKSEPDASLLPPRSKGFHIFSEKNIEAIKNNILQNQNIFIFSLRKGLATITVCRDCDEPLICKNCGAPVVLYTSRDQMKKMYICNRCRTQMDADTICQRCGGWNLIALGIGTDTVVEELKKIFKNEINLKKDVDIFQLDKEIAKNKKGAQKIIQDFENKNGAILVSTEMAIFYLKNKVPLSVVASFDSLWSIPNFRMSEKIIHILLSILSKTENKFVIQTKNINDPVIKAFLSENLLLFVREELEDRQKLNYPPYKRFIKITHQGTKEEAVAAKKILKENFNSYDIEVFSGFIAKSKGKYITNALLKIDLGSWPQHQVSMNPSFDSVLYEKLASLPQSFSVNVDPEDLL